MANLKTATHGKGAMKGVNLVVISYDNGVHTNDKTKAVSRYLDARVSPQDERAAGQTSLALVTRKTDRGYSNSERYTSKEDGTGQFEQIVEAAGDNVAPLTDKEGNVVGNIYGVKADVFPSKGGLVINTKTLEASDFSVGNDDKGRDIREQIFDSQREAKAAREAAAPQAEAPEAEAQAEAPQAENDEPGLG